MAAKEKAKEHTAEPATPTATTPTTPQSAAATSPSSTSVVSMKLDLPNGAVIGSPSDKYLVVAHLANSGLCKVYLVVSERDRQLRVMRMEYAKIPRVASRIRTELALLEKLANVDKEYKSHFLKLYDKGKTAMFKFVIVNQIGPTLLQIREKLLEQDDFTDFTAFYIACGTFQAIRDLHMLGFVHGEILLGRFAIGLGNTFEKQIYMYNLKDIKRFKNERGEHIKRHKDVPFEGSLLFSSRNVMCGGNYSRRDDLESWLYMVFDVFDRQTFSSFFEGRKLSEAVSLKQDIMTGKAPRGFFKKIPDSFTHLCAYVHGLEWSENPNYKDMEVLLKECIPPTKELRREGFLDWTKKVELRKDVQEMANRIFNYRKIDSRPDIVSSSDWSDNSDGSADEEHAVIPKEVKRAGNNSRSKLSRNRSTRKKFSSNNRRSTQRRKASTDKSSKVSKRGVEETRAPPSENAESDIKNVGGGGKAAKGARRYKGSRQMASHQGSKERILEQEPSSHTGGVPKSNETIDPSKEIVPVSTPTTPSKECTIGGKTVAEKQKHAERLRRQMHINVTESTEEEPKFTFKTDKKKTEERR